MLKELIKLATHLDNIGMSKEADYLDAIIKKIATLDEPSDSRINHLIGLYKSFPDEWSEVRESFYAMALGSNEYPKEVLYKSWRPEHFQRVMREVIGDKETDYILNTFEVDPEFGNIRMKE